MFKYATGWLGWSPAEALSATLPQIELALAGKADFVIKTTPGARSTGDKGGKPNDAPKTMRNNAANAAAFLAMLDAKSGAEKP